MALTDSFPGPSGLTDSIEAGKDLAALLRHNSDGSPRAGLTVRPSTALVTARSDLRVDVGAFKAALVRAGAVRLLANDAVAQSPEFTVPPANSRIDVLYVKVGEMSEGDAADGPFFGIVVGTAAATPAKPTLSIDGALELASIQIPSTATATNSAGVTIVQTAPTTGSNAGGPFAQAAGSVASAAVPANTFTSVAVSFPAGRFTVAPLVNVTLSTASRTLNAWVSAVTTSGFTLNRGSTSGASQNAGATWTAVQMTEASAAG